MTQSLWLHSLRCRATVARLLWLWFQSPPGAWMFVCCVLSGRGLCNRLITRPEESYGLVCRVWSHKLHGRGGHSPCWAAESEKKNIPLWDRMTYSVKSLGMNWTREFISQYEHWFSFDTLICTSSEDQLVTCQSDENSFLQSKAEMKLTHSHLMLRLGRSGFLPQLTLCNFVAMSLGTRSSILLCVCFQGCFNSDTSTM
jgi:hypothetical protein